MGLPIPINWRGDSYDSILVIVNHLMKMVHYEPVKVTIDAPRLAEEILDVVVWHHGLPDSIVSARGSVLTSKFWSSLCYFLDIKPRLSTAFYPQTNDQTERQNSTIETTSKPLSTSSRTTGLGSYRWQSLHITSPRMPARVLNLSSSTVATNPVIHTRSMKNMDWSRRVFRLCDQNWRATMCADSEPYVYLLTHSL